MLKRRPSPGMIVAIVALIVGVTGTAMADPIATISRISGRTIERNSLPGNRLIDDTVTGKKINESTLGQVPSAASAAGLAAGVPQVSAFARVSNAGDVQAGKGVTSVVRVGIGQYCFDLAQQPVAGTASAQNTGVSFRTIAYIDIPTSCPAPNNDALVAIETNGAFANQSFNVVFVR